MFIGILARKLSGQNPILALHFAHAKLNPVNIGVLALQGDSAAHIRLLEKSGAHVVPVRTAREIEAIEALIIPGGESTVMSRLCDRYDLWEPLQAKIAEKIPVLGTCAGLIFLAKTIEGGSTNFPQKTLGALDVAVARNAYGAQLHSFETDLEVPILGKSLRAVFIRAPRITKLGESVEVLARHEGAPVLVRQNQIVAASFHPEIAGEAGVHQLWLDGFWGQTR